VRTRSLQRKGRAEGVEANRRGGIGLVLGGGVMFCWFENATRRRAPC